MEIEKAKNEQDWLEASTMLTRVVKNLNDKARPLWTNEQVSVEGLKQSYCFNELYFLQWGAQRVGLVFLQENDSFFWPDLVTRNSLFIHKLAIDRSLSNVVRGSQAIEAIFQVAVRFGFKWIRLDCDDRPELHRFYQSCGFKLVDIQWFGQYRAARYQRLVGTGTAPRAPRSSYEYQNQAFLIAGFQGSRP